MLFVIEAGALILPTAALQNAWIPDYAACAVSHQPTVSYHCWARPMGLYSLVHWVASITGPGQMEGLTVIVYLGQVCRYSFHHWSWLLGLYSWFPAGGVQCGSCTETQQYQVCRHRRYSRQGLCLHDSMHLFPRTFCLSFKSFKFTGDSRKEIFNGFPNTSRLNSWHDRCALHHHISRKATVHACQGCSAGNLACRYYPH